MTKSKVSQKHEAMKIRIFEDRKVTVTTVGINNVHNEQGLLTFFISIFMSLLKGNHLSLIPVSD